MDQQQQQKPVQENLQQPTQHPAIPEKKKNMYILIGIGIFAFFLLSVGAFVFVQSTSKKQAQSTQQVVTQPSLTPTPTVPLKTEYSNPFDEKSQYENPFDSGETYKNPFDTSQ
ncbi:MAG: hypothetical protein HY430_02075 [Candidatus Levybacteria bacterium]|nr:hypothetical protein [Candidatus Levybacteria bacterium]